VLPGLDPCTSPTQKPAIWILGYGDFYIVVFDLKMVAADVCEALFCAFQTTRTPCPEHHNID